MTAPDAGHVIVEDVERAPTELVARLGAAGVATVHESLGRGGLMDAGVRPVAPGLHLAGPAITCCVHPGDNLMLLAALELCRPGDVLVVATAAPVVTGVLGEIIASILLARGAAGAIVDNGVRDVARLRALGLPVWSRGISAMGTTKAGAGSVNVPVVCGGTIVTPGDVVVADDDGVVVVPRSLASVVADKAGARTAAEAAYLARIEAGDVPGLPEELRTVLEDLGVRRVRALADLAMGG